MNKCCLSFYYHIIDAAKRYYRTCREEESRQRRGIAAQRKEGRRKEERILRVSQLCLWMLTACVVPNFCWMLYFVYHITLSEAKRPGSCTEEMHLAWVLQSEVAKGDGQLADVQRRQRRRRQCKTLDKEATTLQDSKGGCLLCQTWLAFCHREEGGQQSFGFPPDYWHSLWQDVWLQ